MVHPKRPRRTDPARKPEQRTGQLPEKDKDKTWLRHEVSYGAFQRSFVLPAGTHPEDVKASHKDGMLTVSMPRLAEEKRRGLDIKVE